ncbi:MAG TPA: dienelactone hydrolase family protein [Roseiflexaceae bacterium]|nr:dienelactone hydrolase family protein [Roseiflexaceae bacterium]
MSIKTEQVTFPANGGSAQGYLAVPEDAGPHRAVIVIQEWWGLDEHIKHVARRFAAEGYVALAPDLYHGAVAEEPDEARKLAMALQFPQAAREMAGAAAYLVGRADVAPKQVGAIGFCLGGSLALLLAATSPHVGAVASFYGGRELPETQLRAISAPVLAIFGEEDASIPPERHAALDRIFTGTGVPHAIYVYPGAPHAFFNDTRPQVHRPLAAQDAWVRTLAWFEKYLQIPAAGAGVGQARP